MDQIASNLASQSVVTAYVERHLVSVTDSPHLFAWFTGWMPATGLSSIRALLRGVNCSSDFRCRVAYQLAVNRPDAPVTPTYVGSTQTGGSSFNYPTGVQAISTGGYMWIRFGVEYWSNTSSAVNQGDVSLQVSWNTSGSLVDQMATEIDVRDTSGDKIYVLTRWLPRIYANYMQASLSFTGFTGGGTIRYEIVSQSASVFQNPADWNYGIDAYETASTNVEFNSGELALSAPDDDMWVRLGLACRLDSTASPTTAYLTALVSAKQ